VDVEGGWEEDSLGEGLSSLFGFWGGGGGSRGRDQAWSGKKLVEKRKVGLEE